MSIIKTHYGLEFSKTNIIKETPYNTQNCIIIMKICNVFKLDVEESDNVSWIINVMSIYETITFNLSI